MSTLIVVDGHNFFNDAGRELTKAGAPPHLVGPYFRDWFDFDRLIAATVDPRSELNRDDAADLGTVIFHSAKSLGTQGDAYRITETTPFWRRQGSAPNTSTLQVDVPGAPSGKDVGMDVAIAVHLFETAPRWSASVLFTADSDLVPAVHALRRQGKRIFCSAPPGAASPLVQASQSFFAWDLKFLHSDFAMFAFLSAGGALDRMCNPEGEGTIGEMWIAREGLVMNITRGQVVIDETLRHERPALATQAVTAGVYIVGAPEEIARFDGDTSTMGDIAEGIARHRTLFEGTFWYPRLLK